MSNTGFDLSTWETVFREFAELAYGSEQLGVARPPNTFTVLGVYGNERIHANLLTWLLDPYADHACGTAFLQVFLESLGVEPELREQCLARRLDIRQEHQTKFKRNSRRVDLRLCWPGLLLLYVEVKVFSGESTGQLAAYAELLNREGAKLGYHNRLLVYLTLSGKLPNSVDASSLDCELRLIAFTGLTSRLLRVAQNSGAHSQTISLLSDWSRTCMEIATHVD